MCHQSSFPQVGLQCFLKESRIAPVRSPRTIGEALSVQSTSIFPRKPAGEGEPGAPPPAGPAAPAFGVGVGVWLEVLVPAVGCPCAGSEVDAPGCSCEPIRSALPVAGEDFFLLDSHSFRCFVLIG